MTTAQIPKKQASGVLSVTKSQLSLNALLRKHPKNPQDSDISSDK